MMRYSEKAENPLIDDIYSGDPAVGDPGLGLTGPGTPGHGMGQPGKTRQTFWELAQEALQRRRPPGVQ
jgi:hypothetical protein